MNMMSLLASRTNVKNREIKTIKSVEPNDLKFASRERRIAYIINGYQFYLSRKMWADYSLVKYGTIVGRQSKGKSAGQILGYEKIDGSHLNGK